MQTEQDVITVKIAPMTKPCICGCESWDLEISCHSCHMPFMRVTDLFENAEIPEEWHDDWF